MSYTCAPVCLVAQDDNGRRHLLRHNYTWDKESHTLVTNYYISDHPNEPEDTLVVVPPADALAIMDEVHRKNLNFRICSLVAFKSGMK